MPNPQALVNNHLKNNAIVLFFVLKLPLPCNRAILPSPLHIIQIGKVSKKYFGIVDGLLVLQIISYWLPQINRLKTIPNAYYKILHTLRQNGFAQCTILIKYVCLYSICKHTDGSYALLQGRQFQHTQYIVVLDKPWIELSNYINNMYKSFYFILYLFQNLTTL